MTTFLCILRLYPLVLWVGGEVFFVVVAGIAFSVLPDTHLAGMVVRGALLALHWIGLGSGVIYLLVTLGLFARERSGRDLRVVESVLAVLMLCLTMYSQFAIIPRMEADRLSIGGDVAAGPANNPGRVEFDRLHKRSVNVEGAVLLGGLVLVALAPMMTLRRRELSAS